MSVLRPSHCSSGGAFVYPEGPLFLVWATGSQLIQPFMNTAALTTTLTCVGGHIVDPVSGCPSSLYRRVTADLFLKHDVASSAGFPAVAVLIHKLLHSYPCQSTRTLHIRTLLLNVCEVL